MRRASMPGGLRPKTRLQQLRQGTPTQGLLQCRRAKGEVEGSRWQEEEAEQQTLKDQPAGEWSIKPVRA